MNNEMNQNPYGYNNGGQQPMGNGVPMGNTGYDQQSYGNSVPMNNGVYNQQPMNVGSYDQQYYANGVPMNNTGYDQQSYGNSVPMNNGGYNQQPMNNVGYNQQSMNGGGYGQQPMVNGVPIGNGFYNQQPANYKMMMDPSYGKKKKSPIALIGVLLLVIIGGYIIYNNFIVESLHCKTEDDLFGVKMSSEITVEKRFNKVYRISMSLLADMSKFGDEYISEEYLKEYFNNSVGDPCKDYGDGCKYVNISSGSVIGYTVTLEGKALEVFISEEDNFKAEDLDIEDYKKNLQDADFVCE